MTEAASDWALAALGRRFRDPDLLARALRHKSAGADNYERLEFLGDRVLGLIHRSIILQEASASRTTVADYAPHSRAYEEYRRLAERVASEYGLM